MAVFKSKKINQNKSACEMLKNARERNGLSLDLLSKQLNIKTDYLQNIELGKWSLLPGEFYIKTYIKKYARSLRLPWLTIQPLLEQELKIYQKWNKTKKIKQTQISKKQLIILPKILNKSILMLSVLMLFAYLGLQIWKITSPPKLEILNPRNQNVPYIGSVFVINGQTEKNTRVKINSQEVFPDETGFFFLQIDLSSGLNLIKVEAKKRYSRAAMEQREIIVD